MRTEPYKITSKVPTKLLFRRCHRCLLKMPPLFRGAAAVLRSSVVSDKEKLFSKLSLKLSRWKLVGWGNLGCRFYTSKYVRASRKSTVFKINTNFKYEYCCSFLAMRKIE